MVHQAHDPHPCVRVYVCVRAGQQPPSATQGSKASQTHLVLCARVRTCVRIHSAALCHPWTQGPKGAPSVGGLDTHLSMICVCLRACVLACVSVRACVCLAKDSLGVSGLCTHLARSVCVSVYVRVRPCVGVRVCTCVRMCFAKDTRTRSPQDRKTHPVSAASSAC